MFRTVVLLALAVRGALSAYSVHYISGAAGPQVVLPSAGAVAQRLEAAPLPAEVADVYARLGGLPPLLNEARVKMPALDVTVAPAAKPVLVHVVGGALPESLSRPVIVSPENERGPALEQVLASLREHSHDNVAHKTFEDVAAAQAWIASQSAPVVLLHEDATRGAHRRALAAAGPITNEEIANYQIFYWSLFVFSILLLSGIYMIVSMEVIPDSLLYAKFQSSRAGKTD